jgi:hypothetical protein
VAFHEISQDAEVEGGVEVGLGSVLPYSRAEKVD